MWLPPSALSYALIAGLLSLLATTLVMHVQLMKNTFNARGEALAEEFCLAFGGIGVLLASAIGIWISELDSVVVIGAISAGTIYWWNYKNPLATRWLYAWLIIAACAVTLSDLVFTKLGLQEKLLYILCMVLMSAFFPYLEKRKESGGGLVFWCAGALAVAAGNSGVNGGDIAAMAACLATGSFSLMFLNFPPSRLSIGNVAAAPTGFLLAVPLLMGLNRGIWSLWFPLLVVSPLLAFAGSMLALNCLRRLKVPEGLVDFACRRHIGHGPNAQQRVARQHLLMATGVFIALLFEQKADRATLLTLLGWGGLFVLFMGWRKRAEQQP